MDTASILILVGAVAVGAGAFLAFVVGASLLGHSPKLRRMTNDAGWKVECGQCGKVSGAGDAGMVRLGAASIGKRSRLRCPACGKTSIMPVYREPTP